ncbi:MAG: cytochrome c [Chloroflexi bacterium]|nr:cytochrome c [Chloroflexota bacterium]
MNARRLVPGVGIAILLAAAACGPSAAPAQAPAKSAAPVAAAGDAARGKELYAQSCASCHGPDAKGIQGLGKDLATSAFTKSQSDADLVAFVKKGRPASDPANTTKVDMPPKGGNPALTDPQMTDIVGFLRTLQK